MENTQVVLTGDTRAARVRKWRARRRRDGEIYPPWFERGDNYQQQQRKKRRGLFGRRWFQDDGPQGYYVPRGNYYRGLGPRGY